MAVSRCGDKVGAWLASYRRPLIGFVLPLVNGDLQAAEDVVQETMIRGWQHAEELHRRGAGSWLHTVARNLAISSYHRRRRARPPEVPFDEAAVPAADDGLDGRLDAWVIAAAGVAGGVWLAPGGAGSSPPTLTLSGFSPATHVHATAALTATSWGTRIRLQVRGLPLNQPCRLVVRSRAGKTEITGYWDAWSAGPVSVPASAAWRPSDITSLQVATATRTLVTITAARGR